MPEISEADLKVLNDSKQQLADLTESTEGFKGEIDNLKAAKVDLERKLGDADTELLSDDYLDFKGKRPKGGADDKTGGSDEFDYDRASGKEIAAHLSGMSKTELADAIKGVTDRIAETEEKVGRSFAQIDVSLTALKHTDFDPNKEAIYKIAQTNPTWGAEKCYAQWKLENKAAIDKKAEDEKVKAEEERKALAEKGEGVAESLTQGKELSAEEAAGAAYDKSFGNEKP